MAKIKHNNFLDTVDEVMVNAKNEGVLHLYATGSELNGRILEVEGKKLYHFGTTGYLGLEQDHRLKAAAIEAIEQYGTQFPLSKSYISNPLYAQLETNMEMIYGTPVIITKNSTLGHLAVLPTAVRDEDGVILDHQVHWSVHHAAQILKTRSIPVEMIRHNNLEMLEEKIKQLSRTCKKVWYLADGVYSMYGDYAPVNEIMQLAKKYPQLHIYFDDVHGMSWKGENGNGFIMSMLKDLPPNVILISTLSKTFGASGATVITSNKKLYAKIKNFGGPLTFSAQLEPASVAAAIASSEIHLSDEIYKKQEELRQKIAYFNTLLKDTTLPLVDNNDSPVHFIATGTPKTGYKYVKRMMDEGYFVNLGIYPAVPVKNTGVRITISNHNTMGDIKALVEALTYHYPKALEETNTDLTRIQRSFKMPITPSIIKENKLEGLYKIELSNSISKLDKMEWNKLMGSQSIFDWAGLELLEKVFNGNPEPENNWEFKYLIIRDQNDKPIVATFFTIALWKDDMLAPVSVSKKVEDLRKANPYHLTSKVLGCGSLITEGSHLFIDRKSPQWQKALECFFQKVEELEHGNHIEMVVLRDFEEDGPLNDIFHNKGFIKVQMPDSCAIDDISWNTPQGFVSSLSKKSQKHFAKDIAPFEKRFEVSYEKDLPKEKLEILYGLYKNVKANNIGLNTFVYPFALFEEMSTNPNWEFIVLHFNEKMKKGQTQFPIGVMFCYTNQNRTYVPNLIGMDYNYARDHQVYRQLLYLTIMRATSLGLKSVDFGMTASFEKKKLGATIKTKFSYVQTKDNYTMELLGTMESGVV